MYAAGRRRSSSYTSGASSSAVAGWWSSAPIEPVDVNSLWTVCAYDPFRIITKSRRYTKATNQRTYRADASCPSRVFVLRDGPMGVADTKDGGRLGVGSIVRRWGSW